MVPARAVVEQAGTNEGTDNLNNLTGGRQMMNMTKLGIVSRPENYRAILSNPAITGLCGMSCYILCEVSKA